MPSTYRGKYSESRRPCGTQCSIRKREEESSHPLALHVGLRAIGVSGQCDDAANEGPISSFISCLHKCVPTNAWMIAAAAMSRSARLRLVVHPLYPKVQGDFDSEAGRRNKNRPTLRF